jgi:parvulin-like peptidyl-prolyl isomerase
MDRLEQRFRPVVTLCFLVAAFFPSSAAPQDTSGGARPPETPSPEAKAPSSRELVSSEKKSPSLPGGVLARLNGKDITVHDYVSYLYQSLGKSRLDEFVDRLLIEEEAQRLEIEVLKEEIESAVAERLDRTIKALYQGEEDRFVENLAKRRLTLEDYKGRARQDLYYETLWNDVILKMRQVTEVDLRQEFERVYGEGGVRYVIRHILAAPQTEAPAGTQAPAGTEGAGGASVRTPAEAKARAQRILKEPFYSRELFGDSFYAAVTQLTPESPLSGVVQSPRGYHIVQLIDKQTTGLDGVKAEIEESLKKKSPTVAERHNLIKKLRAQAKIEGL